MQAEEGKRDWEVMKENLPQRSEIYKGAFVQLSNTTSKKKTKKNNEIRSFEQERLNLRRLHKGGHSGDDTNSYLRASGS